MFENMNNEEYYQMLKSIRCRTCLDGHGTVSYQQPPDDGCIKTRTVKCNTCLRAYQVDIAKRHCDPIVDEFIVVKA